MNQEKLELIIPKTSTGKRIDIALQELMSNYSRAKIQAWIKSGFILLENKKISLKYLRKTPDVFNEAGAIGIFRGAGVFQYCTNL